MWSTASRIIDLTVIITDSVYTCVNPVSLHELNDDYAVILRVINHALHPKKVFPEFLPRALYWGE